MTRPLPAWLALPLSDPAVFERILRNLTKREQRRLQLAASRDGSGAQGYSMVTGLDERNARKNRYCDIVAYDRTRVLLDEEEYVNASLMQEPDVGVDLPRRWWIAAQAPLATTLHAFLSLLLVPPRSSAAPSPALPPPSLIVQLTPLVEGARHKCHPYFPNVVGAEMRVAGAKGGIWVRLESKEESEGRRTSVLRVGHVGDATGRCVTHVEYLCWSDHGVPDSAPHLVAFITAMQELAGDTPILLHCSAGVGRTGTYITVASLLPLVSTPVILRPLVATSTYDAALVVERDFVGLTIDGLREQRCTMVQNAAQVRWCFEALAEVHQ